MMKSFRFSTADLPSRARAAAVRELHERGVIGLEPLPGRALHVEIGKWFLPGASVLSGTLAGLRQQALAPAVENNDDLFLGVNVAGYSSAAQRGRAITLGSGDATLLSTAEGAFSIERPAAVRFLGVRVPRRVIVPLLRRREALAMRLIPRTTEAIQLLTTYAGAIIRTGVPASPDAGPLIASHLHDLIALSLGATPDAAAEAKGGGVRAARLQAIKDDIAACFADASLSLASLSMRHGVSSRYVHRLFEGEGVSYTQFVLELRLALAYRRLRDSRWAGHSISAIAFDVGFGDLSYFNRTFRRRYVATPSDVRHLRDHFPTA